jgi:hypothetical protein
MFMSGPGDAVAGQVSSVAHKLRLDQCTWCVQNARCHHKDGTYGEIQVLCWF